MDNHVSDATLSRKPEVLWCQILAIQAEAEFHLILTAFTLM